MEADTRIQRISGSKYASISNTTTDSIDRKGNGALDSVNCHISHFHAAFRTKQNLISGLICWKPVIQEINLDKKKCVMCESKKCQTRTKTLTGRDKGASRHTFQFLVGVVVRVQ